MGGVQPGETFNSILLNPVWASLGQLMWLKEGFDLARTAMAVATVSFAPARQCSEKKT